MSSSSSSFEVPSRTQLTVEECLQIHRLKSDNVKFVDGSWFLPKAVSNREARAEYEAGPRIEGAQFFDIDDIADKSSELKLPHMMPGKRLFSAAMDALGIKQDDHVIIYGTDGCMFTPRSWFTFRSLGHEKSKCHLMVGSMKEWEEKGGPIENGERKALSSDDLDLIKPTKYQACDAQYIVKLDDVMATTKRDSSSNVVVIDSRSCGRFVGLAPEPRPGLRGGHIPLSLNLPFFDLLEPTDKTKLKSNEDMRRLFQMAGLDDINTDKNIYTSCGSGASACTLLLALEELGREIDNNKTFLYDASWMEWGALDETPIVKKKLKPLHKE